MVFGGEEFVFLPELPWEAMELSAKGDLRGVIRVLLQDPTDMPRFMAHRPSVADIDALTDALYTAESVGESQASDSPSPNGSTSSRPTSRASTRRTSGKSSGGKPRPVSAA